MEQIREGQGEPEVPGWDKKQSESRKLELLPPLQEFLGEFSWLPWGQELWEARGGIFEISLVLCGIKIPPKGSWWAGWELLTQL